MHLRTPRDGTITLTIACFVLALIIVPASAQTQSQSDGQSVSDLKSQVASACTGKDGSKCDQLLETVFQTAETKGLGADPAFRQAMLGLVFLAPKARTHTASYLERILKIVGPDAQPDQYTDTICQQFAYRTHAAGSTATLPEKFALVKKNYPVCKEAFREIEKSVGRPVSSPAPALASAPSPSAEKMASLVQQAKQYCAKRGGLPAGADSHASDPAKCDNMLESILTTAEQNHLGADANFRSYATTTLLSTPYATLEPLRYHERVLKILSMDGKSDAFTARYCQEVGLMKLDTAYYAKADEFAKQYPICKPSPEEQRRNLLTSQAIANAHGMANKKNCEIVATKMYPPTSDSAEDQVEAAKRAEQLCQGGKAAASQKGAVYAEIQNSVKRRAKEVQEHPDNSRQQDIAENAALLMMTGDVAGARKYVLQLEKNLPQEPSGRTSTLLVDVDNPDRSPFGAISQSSYAFSLAVIYHLRLRPNDRDIARNALQSILAQKNRSLDREAARMQVLRSLTQHAGSQLAEQLAKKYNSVNRFHDEYSRLSHAWAVAEMACSNKFPAAQLTSISSQVADLESVLDHGVPDSAYDATPRVDNVRRALGKDDALIEFAQVWLPEYRPAADPPFDYLKQPPEFHYVAYVLRADGSIHGYNLGRAKDIDEEIQQYRLKMQPNPQDDKPFDDSGADVHARKLYGTLWRPLLSALNGVTGHVYLSPDAQLALLSFDALTDDQRKDTHYVIEDWNISYLISGRDLVASSIPANHSSGVAIFADPIASHPTVAKNESGIGTASRGDTKATCLGPTKYGELRYAEDEGKRINQLLDDAKLPSGEPQLFVGAQASEGRLKKEQSPKILHLATHAYYLPSGPATAVNKNRERDEKEKYRFLRSGLLMNEFNQPSSREDGVVTALEVALLNLSGTNLAILSACDSGVGDTTPGDNIAGMRTAFHIAGARAVISTLWSVDDIKGEEIMEQFYRGMIHGQRTSDALRQAKLSVLQEQEQMGHLHPFYWAPFVLEGKNEILFPNSASRTGR